MQDRRPPGAVCVDAFHLEALTALLPAEWTVADVGAGTGYLLGALASRFRQVITVDLVIASLVLHPMARPAEGIGELRRCLGTSGRLMMIEQADGMPSGCD